MDTRAHTALLMAAATGDLAGKTIDWKDEVALTVVMAGAGYPGTPKKGGVIEGLEEADALEGVKVFHAGTAEKDGRIVGNGGRVLNVTATGASVTESRDRAYDAVRRIRWADGFTRSDIGWRAIAREQAKV